MTQPEIEGNVREVMKGPPSGYFIVVPDRQADASDDLAAFAVDLLVAWKLPLLTVVLGGLAALTVAMLLPPKYRAHAVVAPVMQSCAGAGGALRHLGGIAALAGVELDGTGGRKEEYFATLASLGFARDFIQEEDLLPILFAERWNPQAKRWRPDKKPPTMGEAVKRFTNDVVSISDDHRTSLVTVTVDWYSPQLAAWWANRMIEVVNERLRAEATRRAERSLEYLDKELAKTNVLEIRQAIYRLTEEQVNNAMLANVQRDYAYHVIDAAVAPETRYSPKRAVMSSVGAAAGLFLGVMLVYVRRVLSRRRESSMRVN